MPASNGAVLNPTVGPAAGGGDTVASTPYAGWDACSVFDPEGDLVKSYNRKYIRGGGGMQGKKAALRCCAHVPETGKGYGYRHLKARHMGRWQKYAAAVNDNWIDLAAYEMSWTLKDPQVVDWDKGNVDPDTGSAKGSWCFGRSFNLYRLSDGRYEGQMRARVAVGETARKIITAVPMSSNDRYCRIGGKRMFSH